MHDEFNTRKLSNDEAVIKLLEKLTIELPQLEYDFSKQLQIRVVIEEVLNNFDIYTKEKSLVVSDLEEKTSYYLAVKKLDGLSAKTIYNYKTGLLNFARIVKKPASFITTPDIRVYLAIWGKDKKKTSANTQISMLKSFFSWLVDEEYIIKNPMNKIKGTKVPKRLRHAMSEEQLEMIRLACKTNREKALIEFLISTGCRLSEVVNVNKTDLDYNELSLYVVGKGDKERKVYFSAKAKLLLKNYISTRKDINEALFVASKRPYKRLGGRSVEREVAKIAKRVGLDISVYPHLFRHSYGTHNINSGMPLPVLQHLMGHENPSTTLVYSKLSEENIRHEYKRIR